MCEADTYQPNDKEFLDFVQDKYGYLAIIASACGKAAHNASYPCRAKLLALSPDYKCGLDDGVDRTTGHADSAWTDGFGVASHCNQTFHRGPLARIATLAVAFGCVPQDRMSSFWVVSRVG